MLEMYAIFGSNRCYSAAFELASYYITYLHALFEVKWNIY